MNHVIKGQFYKGGNGHFPIVCQTQLLKSKLSHNMTIYIQICFYMKCVIKRLNCNQLAMV